MIEELGGENKKRRLKRIVSYTVILLLIPLVISGALFLFGNKNYNLVSMLLALLACVPFLTLFERKKSHARELVVLAVMTALTVLSRLLFFAFPGFKPVTAFVIITAIAFGAEAGFMTGAMSAVLSNMFFGQGPWTPFQMFAWGIVGFITGLISKTGIMKYKVSLVISGILSGVLFSMLMDLWTVLSFNDGFSWARYLAAIVAGLPFMAVYAVSNVLFLLVLTEPLLKKLDRLKTKYKLFE